MGFKLIPGLLLSDWSASTPPRIVFEAAWSNVDQARDIAVEAVVLPNPTTLMHPNMHHTRGRSLP